MLQVHRSAVLFDNELILYLLENYWSSIENQQKFFSEFASKKGFDPLVLANWKNIKKIALIKKVGKKNSQY